MFRRLLAKLLSPLIARLRARVQELHTVCGFRVVLENTRPDIDSARVLGRLKEALDLLEHTQPWRVAHMRRDVGQIWVSRQPVRGMYHPSHGTIMTELTFLARTDIGPATVASSILHEATHARMHRMNLKPASWNRDREERICRRAELAFGRALPPEVGAPVITRALESLGAPEGALDFEIDWRLARRQTLAVDLKALRAPKGAA